jgi:hypothetical protein
VHVEGVLLDAGDALDEPPLLVVSTAVGEHPHRRRCRRHPRRLRRWIWSASPAASGLGLDLARVGCPRGVAGLWIDAGVCVQLCSSRVFLLKMSVRIVLYYFIILENIYYVLRKDMSVCMTDCILFKKEYDYIYVLVYW